MAKSEFVLGRVKTRKALAKKGFVRVSCYKFHKNGETTLRYSEPSSRRFKTPNVVYRIRVKLKGQDHGHRI